jgi:hypothetical protein
VKYKVIIAAIPHTRPHTKKGHMHGTIRDTIAIVDTGKKSRQLNTLEKYHIYRISKDKLQTNGMHINTYNPIFQIL